MVPGIDFADPRCEYCESYLKPWSDFFFHATIVAREMRSGTLAQVGNFEWRSLPAIVYHYASYSLPVLVAKVGGVKAYAAAVGFWAPFGSFLCGLAAYALGRLLWGEGAGLTAMAAVCLVPDLWLLDLAHPFYGYFWLQHIEPAGLYGVAVAGVSLGLVVDGVRRGERRLIAFGVVLATTIGLFKAHIFSAAYPLIWAITIVGWPPRRRWQWFLLAVCAVAAFTALQVASYLHIGPGIHFNLLGRGFVMESVSRYG